MMNTLGIFRMDRLVPEDLEIYTKQPHYFWLGEVGMAAVLAFPAGCYLTGRTGIALAFILAMIVFMPLFRVPAETDSMGDAGGCAGCGLMCVFGKNEHVMRVIWALSMAIIGLVITKVLDPVVAQEVVGVLTSGGCEGWI